ncbi:MAG: cytochrome-c peroxidase [Blastocatellia bacterium]
MPDRKEVRWRFCTLLVILLSVAVFQAATGHAQQQRETSAAITPARVRLGERLFRDARFATPRGDLPASCASCHLVNEDPQGFRAYTDFFNRSWVSYRNSDPRRFELRNSPTIIDAALSPRLHYDGEFASLEALVKGTFSGRPMGWLPGEETEAVTLLHNMVVNDKGDESGAGSYRELFSRAYNTDLSKLGREQVTDLVARAVADFMRSLTSRRQSPYDQFIGANQLSTAPAANETPAAFGDRLLTAISRLEQSGNLKLTREFNAVALRGLKLFMQTRGETGAGNCVTCHAPPMFTDYGFHNLGFSQVEYDLIHGEGQFARVDIPDATQAKRPSAMLREIPDRKKPGAADLGYWNFVDLDKSPGKRAGESHDDFLRRMIGAVKTPGLRHLAYSYPYMHTGAYTTLEDTLADLLRMSEMARQGRVRAADEELGRIRLDQTSIAPLIAFLNTLNEDLRETLRGRYQ